MDRREKIKQREKREKYLDLARELKKLWNMKIMVIAVVIGLVSRVFAHGPGDRGSIPSGVIPKTKELYLMPPYLTLRIIR